MKIIINIQDETNPSVALERVAMVIEKGRISESRGIKHFCWATVYQDDIVVYVNPKKTKKSADSFIVYQKISK